MKSATVCISFGDTDAYTITCNAQSGRVARKKLDFVVRKQMIFDCCFDMSIEERVKSVQMVIENTFGYTTEVVKTDTYIKLSAEGEGYIDL